MDIHDNKEMKDINNPADKSSKKRMPVWKLIITDALLTCVCFGAFMLYHYVLPRHLSTNEIVVATTEDGENTTFVLPGDKTQSDNNAIGNIAVGEDSNTAGNEVNAGDTVSSDINNETSDSSENPDSSASEITSGTSTSTTTETSVASSDNTTQASSDTPTATPVITQKPNNDRNDPNKGRDANGNITNFGNGDTMDIDAQQTESQNISNDAKTVTQVNSYSSDHIQFTTNKVEIGSGSEKITYYISDVYVTNVKYLKTAFAYGEYGKNYRESTLNQAIDNNALLAINGDYYGNNEIGVVIRNGILYRSDVYDADLCVLFTDGTMKTYSPNEFNLDDIIKQGAWQAWIFGPQLLDGKGNILPKFNSTYYLSLSHPRTAIGYVAPGHYVFLVIDGRNEGYSRGMTLTEMAQTLVDAGCLSAYNLDGGQSSEMVYDNKFVNQPSKGGRDVSDIIYLGE